MIRESELSVRAGEVVADADGRTTVAFTRKWNALVRAVISMGKVSGRGVRRRELPDQTIISYDAKATLRADTAFKVSVAGEGEGYRVTFGFGLLDGIEPVIDGKAITEQDDRGDVPALTLTKADFGKDKRCRLYLKITTNSGFSPETVEMEAAAETPDREPYVARKLVALLVMRDGSPVPVQAAKHNLGFEATERRADGRFRAIFWAAD